MTQLTIEYEIARRQRDEGMDRALDKAERDVPKWGDLALDWLRRYAETHEEFPGWFVTQGAELDPNFPKAKGQAWGAIWVRAQKAGIVRDSGKRMPHPRRHGCPAVVWTSLVFLAAA